MEETLFTRIKRAVDTEKRKQVQGEAKLESLEAERTRILQEAAETTGQAITSKDELGAYLETQKQQIAEQIEQAADILRKEGVEF